MELTTTKNKQTEVGSIPEDWELIEFGDLVNYTKGYAFKSNEYTNSGTRIIRVSDTTFDNIEDKNAVFISSSSESKFSKWKLKTGDLIFSTVGSKPPMYDSLVGKAIFVTEKYNGSLLNQNAVLIRNKKGDIYFQNYLLSHFRTQRYINHIEKIFRGNANQASITLDGLFSFKIPVPQNHLEQKTIAKVLTDTDTLIQALEKKIAKKKLIKKGVIQRLLTPKEVWIETDISKIGQPFGGLSGKSKNDFYDGNAHYIPFMNVMSNPIIDTNYVDKVKISKGELQNRVLKGDLLFNGSSETPEEVGFCSVLLKEINDLYLNSFCFGFRIFNQKEYDGLFLSYYFRSSQGRKFFYSLAQGATRYNLSKTNFLKSSILLPSYEEQIKTAEIIRSIDSEINELSKVRDKYQLAKKGMMQQLLTGKIRLV